MNLLEIIETVKDDREVPYEDLKYAVLALDAMLFFERKAIQDLATGTRKKKNPILLYNVEWQEKESFNRNKKAFLKNPKEYVGITNDPCNLDYQKTRALHKKIYDKVVGEILDKQ